MDGWTPAKDTQPISRMTQFSPALPTHWEGQTQQIPATAESLHLPVLGNVCDLRLVWSLLTSGYWQLRTSSLVGEGSWAPVFYRPVTGRFWGGWEGTQVFKACWSSTTKSWFTKHQGKAAPSIPGKHSTSSQHPRQLDFRTKEFKVSRLAELAELGLEMASPTSSLADKNTHPDKTNQSR